MSYEDSPARIGARLHWFTETPPEPLFQTDPENRGAVTRCAAWPQLWEDIKAARPSLAIVDPVSAALAVAGSAAWYDGARGVLTLVPDPTASDSRLLVAIKDGERWPDRMGSAADGAVRRGRPLWRPGAASADG